MERVRACLSAEDVALLGNAPCLMVPHSPAGDIYAEYDQMTAATYFELLCASRELGAVMIPVPKDSAFRAAMEIPPDHITSMMIGFGWPEIPYARSVQRRVGDTRIHRPKSES